MSSLASKESDAIKCILEAIDRERERVMPIKTVSKAGARSSAHQSVSRLYRAKDNTIRFLCRLTSVATKRGVRLGDACR